MKITVFLSDEGGLEIGEFDQETLDAFLNDVDDHEGRLIRLDMDGSPVYVNKDHIVRIDVD